jgi:hypothetical protein
LIAHRPRGQTRATVLQRIQDCVTIDGSCFRLDESQATGLEVDGCEVSLAEAETALGVVPRGFFSHPGSSSLSHSIARSRNRAFLRGAGRASSHASETAPVARSKEPANLFYVLVVILGVAFLITACGYGTMTYRAIAPGAGREGGAHQLMVFLDHYGMQLMAAELVLLGAATFGAMWLDRFRSLSDERDRQPNPDRDD